LTTAFPDSIFELKRSWLRQHTDISAAASAYRFIHCKIINLTPDEAVCIEARR